MKERFFKRYFDAMKELEELIIIIVVANIFMIGGLYTLFQPVPLTITLLTLTVIIGEVIYLQFTKSFNNKDITGSMIGYKLGGLAGAVHLIATYIAGPFWVVYGIQKLIKNINLEVLYKVMAIIGIGVSVIGFILIYFWINTQIGKAKIKKNEDIIKWNKQIKKNNQLKNKKKKPKNKW